MTTPIALLIDRCGLSQREAALVLGTRPDTVKSWCSGRNPTPPGALGELRALYGKIKRAAEEAVGTIQRQAGDKAQIELAVASDDHEAQALGWPCVGAQEAMLGLVLAAVENPARIVPRGSTVGTAAAADAHDRILPR